MYRRMILKAVSDSRKAAAATKQSLSQQSAGSAHAALAEVEASPHSQAVLQYVNTGNGPDAPPAAPSPLRAPPSPGGAHGLSSQQEAHFRQVFACMDANNDGKVCPDDFGVRARRFAKETGKPENSPEVQTLTRRSRRVFDKFFRRHSAATGEARDFLGRGPRDDDAFVTVDEFLEGWAHVIGGPRRAAEAMLAEDCKALFAVVDTNEDRLVSRWSWGTYFSAPAPRGVPREDAERLFDQVDSDGDGYITEEDLLKFYKSRFFQSGGAEFGSTSLARSPSGGGGPSSRSAGFAPEGAARNSGRAAGAEGWSI